MKKKAASKKAKSGKANAGKAKAGKSKPGKMKSAHAQSKSKAQMAQDAVPKAAQKAAKPASSRTPDGPAALKSRVANVKGDEPDIVDLILRDHVPLKDLLESLRDEKLARVTKEGLVEEFVNMLTAHAKAEEQTLYVEMRERGALRVDSFHGETEHLIAEQLMREINATPDDDEWTAKVIVLAEAVGNHIDEEESNVLKAVESELDLETRIAIGQEYVALKTEIDRLNVPVRRKDVKFSERRLDS